jgi:hypothetical protein
MKLSGFALIAAIAASSFAAMPAAADRVVVRHTEVSTHTTTTRGWHGPRHKVCRTAWVHHRQVKRCTWR